MLTATHPGPGPALDRSRLAASLGDDPQILRELYQLFLGDARRLGRRLLAALAARDLDEARVIGHTLKGSAANIGAEALRSLGLAIQEAGTAQDEALLTALALQVPRQILRVERAVGS